MSKPRASLLNRLIEGLFVGFGIALGLIASVFTLQLMSLFGTL